MADEPCHCRVFHLDCDPSTCQQAKHVSYQHAPSPSLRDLRKSAGQGCQTCATVVSAMLVPEVRTAWRALIAPALEGGRDGVIRELAHDEDAIEFDFDPPKTVNGRRVIRARASDNAVDWMNFNLWREPSVADGPEPHCKAISTLNYHPTVNTDSPETLSQLKAWIDACNHKHACFDDTASKLPTRVVQVKDNQVRVISRPGHLARYTTLSHRWGEHEHFVLTKTNTDTLSQDIPWDSIPKTYQDAIWVTRQLGIDYIWIDTLCIVQDDPDDWHRESVQMKTVYGQSYLNIAASHGNNSNAGLFVTRNMPQKYPAYSVPSAPDILVRQQPYRTHGDFGSNYSSHFKWPLLKRGWVLQERLLSPRVVYFDTEELKWECFSAADCQCGGIVSMWNFKMDYTGSALRGQTPLPFEWMRIAEVYSNLDLTFDEDRAVALSGIAGQAARSKRGGRYLAGVWESALAHQLCWEIYNTHRRPARYIAPSWSWLSVFGSVGNFNRMDYDMTSVIDVEITEVECVTADGTDETGPLVSGYIKFNGRCVEMCAELVDPGSEGVPPTYALTNKETGEGMDGYQIEMDYMMEEEEAREVNEVLVVYWGDMWPDRNNFLVLRPIPGRERTYERFGIYWYDRRDESEELDRMLRWCKPATDIVFI
ncbi:het domain-containing protein [Colletotrichum karsti]|uniref:Het domain-containing protein n=1 Tax=Colletotrichum karsti TaxID=1095194 RepID=A0A9P6IDZ9_9PEZI|nr:het domain-containing protein [Colletotrichum karsti]KAF9880689.1 het domain-containing protein [Colletotrichum karsti]